MVGNYKLLCPTETSALTFRMSSSVFDHQTWFIFIFPFLLEKRKYVEIKFAGSRIQKLRNSQYLWKSLHSSHRWQSIAVRHLIYSQTESTITPLRGYSANLTERKPWDTKPSVIRFPEHIFKLFLFFALLFSPCYYPVCKSGSFCIDTSRIIAWVSYPATLLNFWTCWLSPVKLYEGNEFLKLHKKRWVGREEQPCPGCCWRCAVTSCLVTHQRLHRRQYPYKCPGYTANSGVQILLLSCHYPSLHYCRSPCVP